MSQKAKLIKAYALPMNSKTAKQFAEIDKIIKKTSDKDKHSLIEKGLPVKPLKEDAITTVDIKNIVHSAYFVRSKLRETFDDLDMITELDPIKVVVAEEPNQYYVVDGEMRLKHAKRRDKKQVEVRIIGTVVCQSQIAIARGKEMVKFKKPLTPLELTQGLMQLEDQLTRDFGENAFFSHGGDRKKNGESQQSLSNYIAKTLGIEKSSVKILIRFGRNVGSIGLAGLLSRDDYAGMALREINRINANLKLADLHKKINERANEMIEAGATQDDLIKEVGDLASKIIQGAEAPTPDDNEDNDDDNEDETDLGKLPHPPKGICKGKNNDSDNDKKLKSRKNKKNTVKPIKIVKIISRMRVVLKQLKNDFKDCKGIGEVDQPIVEAKLKRLEGYWGELYGKLGEAGFS